MKNSSLARGLVSVWFATVLSACGGSGGAGDGSDPSTPSATSGSVVMRFDPPVFKAEMYPHDMLHVGVWASTVGSTLGFKAVRLTDPSGQLKSVVTLHRAEDGHVSGEVTYVGVLAPGHYKGAWDVDACYDWGCSSIAPGGARAHLPFDVVVKRSATAAIEDQLDDFDYHEWFAEPEVLDASPLPRVAGLPWWSGYQGDDRHQGHVPVVIAPERIRPRWTLMANAVGVNTTMAIRNGLIYFGRTGRLGAHLMAVRELDASYAWAHRFDQVVDLATPTIVDDRVYFGQYFEGQGAIVSVNRFTGQVPRSWGLWDEHRTGRIGLSLNGNRLMVWGGLSQDFAILNLDDMILSSNPSLGFSQAQYNDAWAATSVGGVTYSYRIRRDGGRYDYRGMPSGNLAFGDYFDWTVSHRVSATVRPPVITDSGRALFVNGEVDAGERNTLFCMSGAEVLWRVSGQFMGTPAVAAQRVYVYNAETRRMEVYDELTGEWLWGWGNGQELPGQWLAQAPLVTDNLVFASTDNEAVALDLKTHEVVWRHPRGGHFAISDSGVLYLVSGGALMAFNLQ